MNNAISYFLGLFTGLIIMLILYIFALTFVSFRKIYNNVVCSFPTATKPSNDNDDNT